MKKLPYVVRSAEPDLGALSRKLLQPRTERDLWYGQLYGWLSSVVPRGSDGELNHSACCIAALALSRVGPEVEVGTEALLGGYYAAEWLLGRREIDWDDWLEGVELDEELRVEIGMANRDTESDWYPGKVGRPPKNAKRSWPITAR